MASFLRKGTRLGSLKPTPKPTFTITPDSNFIFAQDTKKGAIVAVGTSHPIISEKGTNLAKSAFKDPEDPTPHLVGLADTVRKLHQDTPANEPDRPAMRRDLTKGVVQHLADHGCAARFTPWIRSPVIAVRILGGGVLIMWFTGGREIIQSASTSRHKAE